MTGRLELVSSRLRLLLLSAALALAAGAAPAVAAERPAHGPVVTPSVGTPGQRAAEPELEPSRRIGENAAEHGAAPAERHGAGGAADEHGAEGEHGAGMPQLNVATFPSQIFWLVIAFATLFYLMRRKALPRVAEILEARQERIAADLDRAARLREEAEAAQRQHEEVLSQAKTRALEQLRAAQERVAAENAERQAGLDADLNRRLEEAEGRITAAREQALAEVQNVAVEVAQAAVERLTGLRVNEDEARAALGRVVAEAA